MPRSNGQRQAAGAEAYSRYCKVNPDTDAQSGLENLTDMMTDMLHWAAKEKLDFWEAQRLAYMHYEEEKGHGRRVG